MSGDCGFDFLQQNGKKIVDVCGGVLWIWARKMTVENEGLKLLKPSTQVLTEDDLPGWRDTIESKSAEVPGDGDFYDQITCGKVPLDDNHRAMIREAGNVGYASIWHDDLHCWHTHTRALQELGKKRRRRVHDDQSWLGQSNAQLLLLPESRRLGSVSV